MGKLFCILGKSGSGKDTVFRSLIQDRELGLERVATYTTRPMRPGETEGVEYRFVTERQFSAMREEGRLIECRQYDTVRGRWYYGTADDGQVDLQSGHYLMIVTLEAYSHLSAHFGETSVVPLCLRVDDGLRLLRAVEREQAGERPDYAEVCRRFLADEIDFSPEKLSACGIKRFYDNEILADCLLQIRRDLALFMP